MNYKEEVLKNIPYFKDISFRENLTNACLGVAGEAGEVVDLVKKVFFHDRPFNRAELINEMGDVYWYLEYLCAVLEVDREEVMRKNIEKLNRRHPNGWSAQSQNEKRDENE